MGILAEARGNGSPGSPTADHDAIDALTHPLCHENRVSGSLRPLLGVGSLALC